MERGWLERLVLELPDAVVVADADGNVIWGNPAAERIFGVTTAEIEGTNALDLLHPSAAQALMDGVMLAVDRQQWFALPASLRGNQLAGSHETLFVREAHDLSGSHRFVGRLEPSHSHDRAHHEVDLRMSCDPDRTHRSVSHFDSAQAFFFQTRAQSIGVCLRCH